MSHHSCVWRRVGQSTRLPPASGCSCGLTPAPCYGRGGRWRWEVGAGGEDKEVGMWQGEWGRESKDMTQGEPKTLTFCHTWATWNVRSMCCGACTRKVCVCVQLGWHSVYTSVALTAVAAGWVRNLVSAASVQELSQKKNNDSGWLSELVVFEEFAVLDEATSPSCLVLKHSIAHFNFVPLLSIISPLIVLPIALVPWVPIWWVPPAWARGPSRRRGWWLIC